MWIISWMIFLCPPPNIGSCSSLLILSRCVLRCGVLHEICGGVRVVEFGSLRGMQIEGQLFPVFSLFLLGAGVLWFRRALLVA
uniref:Secreted protein n=1 Tax=Triticum urartu TaxID=4572 RepID=A0A8R7UQD3_TRIUA